MRMLEYVCVKALILVANTAAPVLRSAPPLPTLLTPPLPLLPVERSAVASTTRRLQFFILIFISVLLVF